MSGNEGPFRIKEETEKGDIARSLQGLVETHYISKRFKDIMGSTRLSKKEVFIISLMEIIRINSKIMSLSYEDTQDTTLSEQEQIEVKELWALKKRFWQNPHALMYATADSFEYMYGLGLQSLDGLSRQEGVQLIGGAYQKILNPDEMGFWSKIRRRLSGDVLYSG